MRKLIFAINLSLDGCCDHTKAIAYDDLQYYHADLVRNAGTLLYGRKTYQLMVPFWPGLAKSQSGPTKSMNDFALAFDTVQDIAVLSKTMKSADDKKTRILRGDLKEEIIKLKQEKGGSILIGGVDVPSQLIALGLVDEYHFVIQPSLVGEGRRLLGGTNLPEILQLKIAETKVLASGCIAARYLKT